MNAPIQGREQPGVLSGLPGLWEAPDAFLPERWIDPSQGGLRSSGSFMPFGMGPRVCIGKRFALIEASIVPAEMVRRFELRDLGGRPPRPKVAILTRPAREVVLGLDPAPAVGPVMSGESRR